MKRLLLLFFTLLMLIPCSTFSQQDKNTQGNAAKPDISYKNKNNNIYMVDTTEQGMVKNFQDMMNDAETVMYAQVISKESKWGDINPHFSKPTRKIYTVVTFKVFQLIKGSIKGDEVIFYLPGGKIGDKEAVVSPSPIYSLNERAIYFLGNKDKNTYLIDKGRYEIYGWRNGGHGNIETGAYQLDTEVFTKLLKQSVSDTTAYPRFIHQMKMFEEQHRLAKLKYKDGAMPVDSLNKAEMQISKSKHDTKKGNVK
ncbi:MAG: hypothetical protein P4L45_00135 [Ignavibacteriaceae bacterium]|nr:hypothetical protein [Ignavibacteriaceae bacterium]